MEQAQPGSGGTRGTNEDDESRSFSSLVQQSVISGGVKLLKVSGQIVGLALLVAVILYAGARTWGVSQAIAISYAYVGWFLMVCLITIGSYLRFQYTILSDMYAWLATVFETRAKIISSVIFVLSFGGGYIVALWWSGTQVSSAVMLALFIALAAGLQSVVGVLALGLGQLMSTPSVAAIETSELPPRTSVVVVPNMESVNGVTFSVLGIWSVVYISEGAVEALSPEGIQALLGHELGHVANGDLIRFGVAYAGAAVIAGSLFYLTPADPLGVVGPTLLWVVLLSVSRPVIARWTRSREYAADEYSVSYASPSGALELITTIQERHEVHERTPWEQLIQTHPPLSARRRRIEQFQNEQT